MTSCRLIFFASVVDRNFLGGTGEADRYFAIANLGLNHDSNHYRWPLRLGYRATERLTFRAGYTLMYFSQIGRDGDQIDTIVNPNLIPPVTQSGVGPLRPAFNFHPSDLQGITPVPESSF